ncbi:hypothetical protein EFN64_08570 [Leuconostoc citreum]|uniref:hypothetical protein n=1 Tax=Leuconostoc citreum TaxID=33964 RepID=UPI0021A408B0|nr:hypothetical protein [Leuconostoc citreum]MCT3073789.1 hypothetical protein [Leuconostoc citreum]
MYTVLDENLQVKGRLSLNNGQGNTTFFSDTITTQMATDNANDPAGLTTVDYTNQDKQGNAKQWSHSLTISVEATDLGTSINTTDYLMYFDSVADHYYLMKVINTSTDRNSGFITVSAINAAIFELGKQLIQVEQTLAQVDLKTFVSKMYKNAPFSLRVADDNLTVIDYTISANTSLQALLQDLQTKFNVDVDSWVELDTTGHIVDRVLYFGHLGSDNGELVRYGGAKGFENMTATEVSDIIYTKLYVTGKTDDKDAKKGHIGSVNNGMEYIVDDDANQRVYAIGASQQQPVYLEGTITNSLLSEPKALLEWAKQQIGIFNHPRFNYTVTPLHDQIVSVGDTVTVQDFHIKPEILVTSKVIQKTVSFASPETNTFVLGEFSSIFTDNMNKSANVINLIKKDVTVVQAAADVAKAQADAAYQQAVTAQEKAIHAQTSADGKTTTYTADSVQDLPQSANEGDIGWVKLFDGTHMYSYTDGKWVEKINPSMGAEIDKKVSDVVIQAKDYSDKAIADNQTKIDESIKSVDDKANQLKQDQSALDIKAQDYANQAKIDAITNTTQAVKETLDNSQKALDQVKFDLTNGIAKEATDRQNAVNALDKTAQGYANQAKSDALNTIAKEATDRQNAVSALDTKAINAVNQAKSDITDTINAISVGGRNLILGTEKDTTWTAVGQTNNWSFNVIATGLKPNQTYTFSAEVTLGNTDQKNTTLSLYDAPIGQWLDSTDHFKADGTRDHWTFTVPSTVDSPTASLLIYAGTPGSTAGKSATCHHIKLETGNITTDWTSAPEDVVLDYTTKDNQIKETITQYQETNDGKVSKVQTDVSTALGQVATKVSQTDYDKKTGDLSTKYTEVKQTADSQAADIVDIKKTATSQASKINSISSDVDGTKQSISDIETTQDSQSDKVNQITNDVNGTKQSITDIQTKDDKQDTRMGTIETSVSGVKSDFSSYKTTNDGVVKTAQTTAQTAVDGLKNKVSQTDYNTKTGQLQTDLTTATQTANQATTDIASIKKKDGEQDAKMNTIVSDANGTKQTVSDLQTAQGKQSGYISTLQQRADGFDATVTKVNNLQVGGRNLLLGTAKGFTGVGLNQTNVILGSRYYLAGGKKVSDLYNQYGSSGYLTISFDWVASGSTISGTFNPIWNNTPWGGLLDSPISPSSSNLSGHYEYTVKLDRQGYSTGIADSIQFRQDNLQGNITISNLKLESGNQATDWTPAPEDLDSATAKAQLTADQAKLSINNYKTDADGLISKAQADIITNANAITQKVSQTDYNAKTGDLSTKVSTAQQTADQANTTIGNYQKSNDGRITSAESAIKQNADGLELTATKQELSDTDAKTNYRVYQTEQNVSQLKIDTTGISSTVSKLSGDTDSKFSQQQQKIDSINSTVQQQGTNINNVSTRVQTAEGNISTAQNNITGLQSSQKQTADGLSQEVSDRKSGDSTVLQQGKDFTTSQVSNSETNMKSLINQKADSATVGVIQNDVTTLKANTQWQRIERFDDMNFLTQSGRFFIGASARTNSAVSASFYIMVDAPQPDRITQTQWKDLDGSLMYRRTYNGSSWTPWTQMVMSSTLLNIFHDSWSLGTSTNDGITKQMVTGIMGQPDGTLILKGNSLILDGNTTVTGDFYAKGGNFQNLNATNIKFGTLDGYQVNIANVNVNNLVGDTITGFNFNVNKQMTIAPGGIIQSDVIHMDKDSFTVRAPNINSHRISSEGYTVFTRDGVFNISSGMGSFSSDGNISVASDGNTDPYKRGIFHSEYGGNNLMMSATGYTNSDPDEFLNMSSARLDYMYSKTGLLSDASQHTSIRANLIETTGTLNAFGVTQTPRVYSWPNLTLESIQQSVVLKAGNQNILQVRENSYVYLLTRHSGSGGSSLQIAGDGALFVQSSASKYKEDIKYDGSTSVGDKFLTLDPATWQDKDEYEQRKLYRETGIEPTHQIRMTDKRYYGLIAEDLVKAGLEEFVVRDEVTGEVNGLEYDKVAISLIPVVREQRDAINELRLEVERLKQK